MKVVAISILLLLITSLLFAQQPTKKDTIVPGKGDRNTQLKNIKEKNVQLHSDSTRGNQPKKTPSLDTTKQNKYGDLLRDDTAYNKTYSFWKPAVEVLGTNALILGADRYVFKYPYSTSVGLNSWKHNINTGWAWDNDRFGINFSAHPYTGAVYFNAGRANGYGYLGSLGFTLEGSLMWEYFGENTLPSYTDLINTTVNGSFLGEILYRVSSNVLDDRSKGAERTFREILAAIIDPMRGFNRLTQGKTFRKTNKEVYAKEPLNVTLYGGIHSFDNGQNNYFAKGTTNEMFNLQLDYGNPFEVRKRSPFDLFRLRTELAFGAGRKILDEVQGYGILLGKNVLAGKKFAMLIGGFQYYDYFDSKTLELMAIGFGGGVLTKLNLGKHTNLYTNFHIAAMPLGANNGRYGPDTTQIRDYSYDSGIEGKIECTFILDKYFTLSVLYYYYYIHTHPNLVTKDYGFLEPGRKYNSPNPNDIPGNNYLSILKPSITTHIYKYLSVGLEHDIFYDNRYTINLPLVSTVKTEEKIFLLLYFENKQRKGHYY